MASMGVYGVSSHTTVLSAWRSCCVFLVVTTTAVCITAAPPGFSLEHQENRLSQDSVSVEGPLLGNVADPSSPEVTYVLHQMLQVLQERDQHTALYERVAVLEGKIMDSYEDDIRLKTEFAEMTAKIPVLEEQIANLTIMKQKSDVFELKMEKLIHKYEEKLSTLASEIIRLKKNEAKFKDLQALSDETGNNILLRREIEECPSVSVDLHAVRIGEECLYMAWRSSPLNWSAAHDHCQALGGDLAAPQDLLPLKTFLHTTFARGPSLWLGASYDEFITSSSHHQRSPPYNQHQSLDSRTATLMLQQLKEEDQEVRDQGGGNHTMQGHDVIRLQGILPNTSRYKEMQAEDRITINNSLQEKIQTGYDNVKIGSYLSEESSNQALQATHDGQLSDSITPLLVQRVPDSESEGSVPSKVRCLLLWLNQALEYELVGRPCNEQHYFVCQLNKERKLERPLEMDSLLQE